VSDYSQLKMAKKKTSKKYHHERLEETTDRLVKELKRKKLAVERKDQDSHFYVRLMQYKKKDVEYSARVRINLEFHDYMPRNEHIIVSVDNVQIQSKKVSHSFTPHPGIFITELAHKDIYTIQKNYQTLIDVLEQVSISGPTSKKARNPKYVVTYLTGK
jgi:hypothetical protein